MEVLGWIFLVLIGLTILLALVMLIRSVPDINRYRRLKAM